MLLDHLFVYPRENAKLLEGDELPGLLLKGLHDRPVQPAGRAPTTPRNDLDVLYKYGHPGWFSDKPVSHLVVICVDRTNLKSGRSEKKYRGVLVFLERKYYKHIGA